jgi:hypothetical protein
MTIKVMVRCVDGAPFADFQRVWNKINQTHLHGKHMQQLPEKYQVS